MRWITPARCPCTRPNGLVHAADVRSSRWTRRCSAIIPRKAGVPHAADLANCSICPKSIVARDILPEIRERLKFLREVGLGYLQLGRGVTTLSSGESQRIRLAAQLGSNLSGVLYVLDEPTIGLHARDNEQLLSALDTLRS